MEQKSLFSVISPIMAGPSSSHTAGAVRLGLMARNIYNKEIKKVKFILYNSFATTGFGHGTDRALLAGLLGYSVDSPEIKNIFEIIKNIDYSYEYRQDISRHPNSVDFILGDMTISGDSIGAGEIQINNINGFSVHIDGTYDTLILNYKDKPGMISTVCTIIQKQKVNIASLHCDRDSKGGDATMYIGLDVPLTDNVVEQIRQIEDVYYATKIRKLK